jgi:hypothetical protein
MQPEAMAFDKLRAGGLTLRWRRFLATTRACNAWERLALAVWLVALLVICGRVLVAQRGHSVYPIYATAARNWLAGADLYNPAQGYRYSPTAAVLLTPFSALPDALGEIVWRLLTTGIYLVALAWWAVAVLPGRLSRTQRAVLFLLVVPLSIGNLNNGQSNLLVIGLLLAATAGAARQRWNLTAACVTLACLFKVYPIATGLLLALVYPRRLVGRLLVALAAGLIVPFLVQEPQYVSGQYLAWLHHLQSNDRQNLPVELVYRDIRLLWHAWQMPLSATAYAVIQFLAGAGIAALCLALRCARREERQLLVSLLGLGCCWMTLFGPATESCTYGLLAPTLAWAVLEAWLRRGSPWLAWVVIGSYGLFACAQLLVCFPEGRCLRNLGSLPLAATVLFTALLLQDLRRFARPAMPAAAAQLPRPQEAWLEEAVATAT